MMDRQTDIDENIPSLTEAIMTAYINVYRQVSWYAQNITITKCYILVRFKSTIRLLSVSRVQRDKVLLW